MHSYAINTCVFHICDMFDKIPFMASTGPV